MEAAGAAGAEAFHATAEVAKASVKGQEEALVNKQPPESLESEYVGAGGTLVAKPLASSELLEQLEPGACELLESGTLEAWCCIEFVAEQVPV